VKQVGAAGAAALSSGALAAQPAPAPPQFAETPRSVHPTLNRRARGWLRFLWEKATTPDDWSADGVPHMWWDRYSNPVVTSYGRFDLHNSSYALLLMADETPAWREVYTRIADGLASRYPTYWGAIDWLTQIGDDPRRANYPPHVMQMIPERLRGNYNRIGWTANGIEPWGLSPDPIGSEGNLFFRGWFNLVLSIYKYVSGDDKYERPFEVTGYGDQVFEWDQHRIAELLERQYRERPEGPQCENTKIWFPCNAAAGLGMYLYDRIHGRATHRPVEGWLEYARENFLGIGSDGRLEWVTSYYDPIVNHKANGGPGAGVGNAFLLLPQDLELATLLYESAANALGWNDPSVPVQPSPAGTLLAREFGDHTSLERLRAAAELAFEPKSFGDHDEMFGWWFGLNDGFPRGQLSAQMMLAEVGEGDAWGRALEAPHLDKYAAPTVEGVDFPSIGLYQAWNDTDGGALNVGTYAAAPDRRGMETSWRVTNLPNPDDVYILCDGQPFSRFAVDGPGSIRIDGDIAQRHYQIFTGYRGESAEQADARRRLQRQAGASASAAGAALAARGSAGEGGADGRGDARVQEASTSLASGDGPTCACCVA
jgi:hypothetical protein